MEYKLVIFNAGPCGAAFFYKVNVTNTFGSSTHAIIITNGPLPDPASARRYIGPDDRLICADGGAHHAQAMGLLPHVVVGDLDSLEPDLQVELETAGVRFEKHPVDKDQTDLELALQLAIAEGATEVDVLAVLGGRLDQSLANLMLLARPEWASIRVRAIAGEEIGWPVRGGQIETIEGTGGDTLSLVPLSPTVTGVTLEGVKWPLHDVTLHFGSTLTMSNVLTKPSAYLQIKEGLLFVIHQSILMKEDLK
jgi:thiamine pyrophosphokinase